MRPDVGARIRALRKERGLTLEELGRRSGVSMSTLSKIENNQSAAQFDTLLDIADGLAVTFEEILLQPDARSDRTRLTTTRSGEGHLFSSAFYQYEVHSMDLLQKKMIPLRMTISTTEPVPMEYWSSHAGEEFIYVLKGSVELHTEFYAPRILEAGDSAYIDSAMKHAFVSRGVDSAEILSICMSHSLDLAMLKAAANG